MVLVVVMAEPTSHDVVPVGLFVHGNRSTTGATVSPELPPSGFPCELQTESVFSTHWHPSTHTHTQRHTVVCVCACAYGTMKVYMCV